MKQLSDQELDRRISSLKKRLEQTATRDANLRHHLSQGEIRQWTDKEMMESDEDPIELAAVLLKSLSDPQLSAFGTRGNKLVQKEFNWVAVGEKLRDVYHWLTKRGPVPECVELD